MAFSFGIRLPRGKIRREKKDVYTFCDSFVFVDVDGIDGLPVLGLRSLKGVGLFCVNHFLLVLIKIYKGTLTC